MTVAQDILKPFPILRRGNTGTAVERLQHQLRSVLKIKLTVDGLFDVLTETAVKQFQERYGLEVNGIAGDQTQKLLDLIWLAPIYPLPTLEVGSTEEEVQYLQALLNYSGYTLLVDGVFGTCTSAAVKQLQTRYGLMPDGIVSRNTWSILQYQFCD